MVQALHDRPPGAKGQRKKILQPDQNNRDAETSVIPFLKDAATGNYRVITVSTEDSSGKISTHVWKSSDSRRDNSQSHHGQCNRSKDASEVEHGALAMVDDKRRTTRRAFPECTSADMMLAVESDVSQMEMHLKPSRLRSTAYASIPGVRLPNKRQDSLVEIDSTQHALRLKREVTPEESPVVQSCRMESFRIDDEEKVTSFLRGRLQKIQQIPNKAIAKAWIKGVCSKKQGMFPYSKKNENVPLPLEPGQLPGWWPDLSLCPFVEPDHIHKEHRTNLLLHLLRLRPQPEQLVAWNKGKVEATHIYGQWTAFLKSLTPEGIFPDGKPIPEWKKTQRWKHFMEIYEVAEMEEEYVSLGMGGEQIFQYVDEAPQPVARKRIRKKEPVVSHRAQDADIKSASSSNSRGEVHRSKRRQPSSGATSVAEGKLAMRVASFGLNDNGSANAINIDKSRRALTPEEFKLSKPEPVWQFPVWAPQAKDEKFEVSRQHSIASGWPPTGMWGLIQECSDLRSSNAYHQRQPPHWQSCNTSPSQSFDSSMSAHDHHHASAGYPVDTRQQDFMAPQYLENNMQALQVNQVAQLSSPHFDTVPNTPVYSPITLTSNQNFEPYPSAMPVATGVMPVQNYPFVGAYADQAMVQPMQHQSLTHGLPAMHTGEVNMMPYQEFTYDDQFINPPFESTPWDCRGFTGHSSGVGGGQPT